MKDQEVALIAWLQKVVDAPIENIQTLRNPYYFYVVCQSIKSFSHLTFSQSESLNSFHHNLVHLKKLYEEIKNYFKEVIHSPIPTGMPPINCFQIAKGEDRQNEGLIAILTLIFISCLKSENKDFFIGKVVVLESHQQETLMKILTQSNDEEQEEREDDQLEEAHKKNEELYIKLQQVCMENQAVYNQLNEQMKEQKRQHQLIKRLQEELQKVKRELSQKSIIIQQFQEKSIEHETSKQIISQSNEELVEQLKADLIEHEKKYVGKVNEMSAEIETIKQELEIVKIKNSELQETGVVIPNRKVDHKDCISVIKHKNEILEQQMKLNNKDKKNCELERRIVVLEGSISELQRKNEKIKKQLQKLQEKQKSSESSSKLSSQYVSVKTAKEMKFEFLRAIKSDLERRIAIKGNQ